MSRWVRHISGQGEKWPLFGEQTEDSFWICKPLNGCHPWLPRSEYRECPPPRRRVTGECYIQSGGNALGFRRCDLRTSFLGTTWALIRKEDLTDGEVCLVIEEGE